MKPTLQTLFLALLAAFAFGTASAQPAASGGVAVLTGSLSVDTLIEVETQQSNGVSLSQAVAQVRRQYGGRILSADTERRGNREVHVIRVLTEDNKVKTVRVNGRRLNRGG